MQASMADVRGCLASNYLQLILMPTEACNFRCVYCYEEFRYKRMEPWVVRGVTNLLTRKAVELDALTLSWFGGEPLLARNIIDTLLQHARLLKRRHPKLRISSDMTTNAYLLSRDVFERLLALGVTRYQVTFDGPRELHDRRRLLANGGSTFDRIWNNLLAIKPVRKKFQVVVRVHVDQDTVAAIPRFLEDYGKAFGSDSRFRLYLRKLSLLGGPNDDQLHVFAEDEAAHAVEALSRCADEHRAEQFNPGPPICYAARGNSFVIRANGRLNKCTVALEHPMNQVGRLHEDGRIELEHSKALGWMRGLWSRQPNELECPMRGYADPVAKPSIRIAGGTVPPPIPLTPDGGLRLKRAGRLAPSHAGGPQDVAK